MLSSIIGWMDSLILTLERSSVSECIEFEIDT